MRDYSLNKLNAPYGKYWYIDPDKVADYGKQFVDWGKSQEANQAAKFGTVDPMIIGFTSDATGGFGGNGPWLLQTKRKRIAGTDSQEISGMRFKCGKDRRR